MSESRQKIFVCTSDYCEFVVTEHIVYATGNFVVGLLFGVKQDDFDFCISTDENGLTTVYECYPDAYERLIEEESAKGIALKE